MTSSHYLLHTSRDYAIYVAENRAIPHVADGLKHGQRIALWVLRDKAEKIKTMALSGLMTYQRLYVHGDQSCNKAISLLAAPYKNNVPLIEGLGEFGSRVAPDAIGAPRYTEVRRSKAAEAILYNDLAIVPVEDNYDGSAQQPKHFLPLIPIVLLNGVTGIAVGWSTNILPRSLKSLIDATKQALAGQPVDPIPPSYARYDLTVTSTGPNQWEFTGRAAVLDGSNVRITELPPGLTIESFRRRLIEMETAGTISGYTDRSTERINITVRFPRGALRDWSDQSALDFFKLRERVTERLVVINWQGAGIRTYATAEQLIVDFTAWRLDWYRKRFEYLRARDQAELHFWRAIGTLFKAKFPQRLGSFKDRAALEQDVTVTLAKAKITLDAASLDRIVHLATYRWTRAFAEEVAATVDRLQATLAEHEAILASPDRLRAVYRDELDGLRRLAATL